MKVGKELSEGLSSAVLSFKMLIQQRDVMELANKALISWRGSYDPKSHIIIRPELSGNNGQEWWGQTNKLLTSAKQHGEIFTALMLSQCPSRVMLEDLSWNICQAKHNSLIAAHTVVSSILYFDWQTKSEVLYFYRQLQVIPKLTPMIVLIIIEPLNR